MSINLSSMITEGRNSASQNIDELSTLEMLKVINSEDKKVAIAVEQELDKIAQAVDIISKAFVEGGRLIYMGAGTSGRLGILDASECPPTYGIPAEQVIGLIAGGMPAILKAVENAEDSKTLAVEDLQKLNLTAKDVVVGIAASGRTPYAIGGMEYAKSVGAAVMNISCNPESAMSQIADVSITPVVGPEVVTGSSRMKAGTAQKLVLNMLTTGSMIKAGKVYGNLMVDVEATNAKLIERQKNIVMQATGCSKEEAEAALQQCERHCKTAIVMVLLGKNSAEAKQLLHKANGFIRNAIR